MGGAAARGLAEAAPAKVNLYLRVTGRRPDGYHLLDSLAVFAGVADRIAARPAPDLTLRVSGPGAAALACDPGENLVLRAARSLREQCAVAQGAAITLEKRLPVASGIGGGSADAAAALRVLVRLWGLSPSAAALAAVAEQLGSDVPVCLAGRPARMRGVGEVLEAAPSLPEFGLLLVNPGVSVRTPEVFRARSGGFSGAAELPDGWPDAAAMAAALRALGNDLAAAAERLSPSIGDVVAVMRAVPGCLLAQMSGSGATCFGLFATPRAAAQAASATAWPAGWWVWGGASALPPAATVEAVRGAAY